VGPGDDFGEGRLRALLKNVSDTITVIDANGRVLWQSGNPGGTLGMPDDFWLGRSGFDFIHPDDVEQMGEWLAELLSEHGVEVRGEYRIAAPGGEWTYVDASAVNLIDDPVIGGIVLTTRNINERKQHEARLQFLAMHDALTGLPNRALLTDRLEHSLARLHRTTATVALMFCDLDDFKLVNDTFGHATGDDVLVAFAERMSKVTRAGDTVARFGGDEFLVLCEDVSDAGHARAIATRIDDELAAPLAVGGELIVLRASIGVAVASSRDDTADALLREADAAMYRAKKSGRGRIEVAVRAAPADGRAAESLASSDR
jgi:diguanylate cyclase (GGDEF)-like protein/PAS domain S-box-containing protein